MEARDLCDKQINPPCAGWIWTGPIGIGTNKSSSPTPNTVMLCAGFREYYARPLPQSKYQTGAVIQDYMVYPNRFGLCSEASQLAIKYDIASSLQARQMCDRFDGSHGPRCVSYLWERARGSVRLCGGVPQQKLTRNSAYEVGFVMPHTCEIISNRW